MVILQKIGVGLLVGGLLAWLGMKAAVFAENRKWTGEEGDWLLVTSLAFTCFALAESLGGSGFIASFVGGLVFGALCKHKKHHKLLSAHAAGDTLALITWVIFGAMVVGQSFKYLTWPVLAYAVLSLTLIRMLPVWLALLGSGLQTKEKLFIGWFGPRGMASVVFVVMVCHHQLPQNLVIASVTVCTVTLSIVLHGISANPLVKSLTRQT